MSKPRKLTGLDIDSWFSASVKGERRDELTTAFVRHRLKRKYPIRFALIETLFSWLAGRAKRINGMSKDDARWLI